MCPSAHVLWPSPWPIAGVDNLACFEYLLFRASFCFSLFTLIQCYSVVKSFFSLWPSMVTVVLMRFLLAYRLRVVLPLAERRRFR